MEHSGTIREERLCPVRPRGLKHHGPSVGRRRVCVYVFVGGMPCMYECSAVSENVRVFTRWHAGSLLWGNKYRFLVLPSCISDVTCASRKTF